MAVIAINIYAITSCAVSEKAANTQVAPNGGAADQAASGDNKRADNKPAEDKPASEKQILWDFRKDSALDSQKISKAETSAVLKYLFGDEANQKIEIRNRVSGAFTKPNAKETLYYLSGCEDDDSKQFTTDCPHVSWDSVGWLAIYDGTTPVLKINEALGSRIEKVTDVNGDGISEILSFGGYNGMGISNESLSLGQISAGKYQAITDFQGYVDNCAEGDTVAAGDKSARAAVISYMPANGGKMPEFSADYFKGKCKDDSADKSSWEKTTKKDFEDFFNGHS